MSIWIVVSHSRVSWSCILHSQNNFSGNQMVYIRNYVYIWNSKCRMGPISNTMKLIQTGHMLPLNRLKIDREKTPHDTYDMTCVCVACCIEIKLHTNIYYFITSCPGIVACKEIIYSIIVIGCRLIVVYQLRSFRKK